MLDIDYQRWMDETSLGRFHRRSSLLRKVDDAIRLYCTTRSEDDAFKIRAALDNWKSRKQLQSDDPGDLENERANSERDRYGAVTALETQLQSAGIDYDDYRQRHFTPDEIGAYQMVANEKQGALERIFADGTVVFLGNENTTGTLSGTSWSKRLIHPGEYAQEIAADKASSAWDTVKEKLHIPSLSESQQNYLDAARPIAESFYGVAKAAFGDQLWDKIKGTGLYRYIDDIIKEVTASVPPWLGTVWDARSVGQEWAEVTDRIYHRYDIGRRDYQFSFGTTQSALAGMKSALSHEIGHLSGDAAISTASFIAKTVTTKLDAGAFSGPLIGLGAATAKLAHRLIHLGVQYRAVKAFHEILAEPSRLDLTVFKTYPLLGAYFLHCSTFSDLIPVNNLGTPGWTGSVERMRKDARYVFIEAKTLIDASPFKIIGLQKIKRDIVVNDDAKFEAFKDYGDTLFSGVKDSIDELIDTAVKQTAS